MAKSRRVTSTDYAHPRRPALLRLYNRAGALLGSAAAPLEVEGLLAAARAATGLADFGDPAFREPLTRLLDSMHREARLTALGRSIMRGRIGAMLENRLRIEALHRAHPEIAAQPIRRPIVIAGLQRTGTTLLHRLLAADPQARALLSWEALSPAPLPGEGDRGSFRRRAQARLAELGLRALAPDFFAIHPVEAGAPEEDVLLLDHAFTSQAPEATLHVPSYAAWLETQDLVPSYRYLERVLKVLSWQRDGAHWVLKTPHHMEYLRELLTVFPDAVIVQTHRDPQVTTGSFCSMVAHARGVFSDVVDPREVGRHWLRKLRRMIDRSLAARDSGADPASVYREGPRFIDREAPQAPRFIDREAPQAPRFIDREAPQAPRFIDVSYYDLLADPLGQVRRIYTSAGIALTPAAEAAMTAVLARDTQHRHGRHVYRARDFGLSPARIEEAFAGYRARFAIPREAAGRDDSLLRQAGASGVGHGSPITATLTGVLDLVRQGPSLPPIDPDQRLDGKTAVVTGASSGLGKAVAIDLARRGARLILPLRGGIPEAGAEIARASGSSAIEMLPVDLADLDSVVALTRTLAARRESVEHRGAPGFAVDLLICNAGLVPARAVRTRQGFEAMFAVHYLANHLLVRRLLAAGVIPNGVFAGNGRVGGAIPRIVFVSSEAHRSCAGLDFDRFGDFADYGLAEAMGRYCCSKLAMTTLAVTLAGQLATADGPSVAVHALCPGPVDSRLGREAPALVQPLLEPIMHALFRSPDRAAAPVLYLAAAPELDGDTGWYLHLMRRKTPSPAALDPQNGRALWERGEALLAKWIAAA